MEGFFEEVTCVRNWNVSEVLDYVVIWAKSILGRGRSKYKDFEAGMVCFVRGIVEVSELGIYSFI